MPNPIINIRTVMVNTAITIAMLVNAFKSRVLADGGTYEGEGNLLNQNLANINAASFVFIPSGYKVGLAHSFKGGDLTFTRNSLGTRNNSVNVIETMAANVPCLEYINGIPTLFLRPIRTNILPTSNDFTGYVKDNITVVGKILTENTINSAHRIETPWFAGHTLNTIHTFSVLVKQSVGTRNVTLSVSNGVDGDIISQVLNLTTGVLTDSIVQNASWSNATNRVTLMPSGDYLFELSGQSSVGNSRKIRVNMLNGNVGAYLGNGNSAIEVSHFQSEVGTFASSRIVTTGTILTRIADNLQTQNLGNLTNYSLFIDQILTFDSGSSCVQHIFNSSAGLALYSVTTPTGIRFYNQLNSQNMFVANSGTTNKFILTFNGTLYTLVVNGVKIGTYTPPNTVNHNLNSINTLIQSGFLGQRDSVLCIRKIYLFNKVITDQEAINLTT